MEATSGTVFIVEDDETLRHSIARLLTDVGIASETFSTARAFLTAYEDQPGCLLVDVRLPGMSGIDLQKTLIENRREIPMILMTGHGDVPMAVDALKRGAMDFVEKPFRAQVILDLIRKALEKGATRRAEVAELSDVRQRFERLTEKERAVVSLVVQGKTNKEIASVRGVSSQAIDATRKRAMEKLGVGTIAEMVQLEMKLRPAE